MHPSAKSLRIRLLILWLFAVVLVPVFGRAQSTAFFPQSVASGDPRPGSVVFWTRVLDVAQPGADLPVTLEIAGTPAFNPVVAIRTNLLARAAHDGCVKVRVEQLQPWTTYWYRFVYQGNHTSALGRTKTAPAPDAAQPVRFAFLNCQDYVGRYYNTLAHLVSHEANTLDFIVYLGDYVYETTGDPSFQTTGSTRKITFGDTAGAIALGSGETTYQAASSLDNYRDLYRTYRSDRVLQRLHELFPVIAIWDDHEFSNDHWRETAAYFNGVRPEADVDRKRHAEQAYFEYLPVDVGLDDQGVKVDETVLYPNTRLYRDLQFGQYLHLLMTDYRTYRPDHLIAEDAFPGEIIFDEPTASALLGDLWSGLRGSFDPYVNVEEPANAVLKAGLLQIVTGAYLAEGLDAAAAQARAGEAVQSHLSAIYVNGLFQAAGQPAPLSAEAMTALPRGLSYLLLGKQELFTSIGSRYLVPRLTYQLYAAYRGQLEPESQDAYGPEQTAWLSNALAGSGARWKVVGSSVSFAPLVFDFAQPPMPLPTEFPPQLRTQLQLNADDWDGFPKARQLVIDLLAQHEAVVISGDIHASFVTRHLSTSGKTVPEFTGTSVSSESFREELANEVAGNPALAGLPGVNELLAATDLLLIDAASRLPEADILEADTTSNGYVIIEATGDALRPIYRHWPASLVEQDLTGLGHAAQLAAALSESRFVTTRSTNGLVLEKLLPAAANFRLQLLHASDLEGGVNAIQDAPNFAAIVDRFTQVGLDTVIVSAGDNYIPGPFFSAAGDPALRGALDAVNEGYFGLAGLDIRESVGRSDLTLMNVIGFDASALGNHEFDAGTA
ncbi:MAG: alkaline phosphatase D family protein, partial [Limisphaerales bacterium]